MSADAETGIVAQQREDEYIHRMNLPFSAGVGRTSVAVEAALIANTDTIQVVSLGVRTYPFNLPRRLDAPVLTDVEMIPTPLKPRRRWHTSKSSSVKSLSALVAEQWITIRSIFLINLSFHSSTFSLSAKEKQDFQYNI